MTGRACRVCGCTDQFGCEEGCHWVEPDLCSVCSGATPRRHRHYILTLQAAAERNDAFRLADAFGIYAPMGYGVASAHTIADAQLVARGLDLVNDAKVDGWLANHPAKMISAEIAGFTGRMNVTQPPPARVWQRGPIARRPRAGA